jgi:membrane protease YdiL (CAAX protease family)
MYSTHPPSRPSAPLYVPWGWLDLAKVVGLVGLGIVVILSLVGEREGGITSPVIYIAIIAIYGLVALGVYLFAGRRRGGWQALGMRVPPLSMMILIPVIIVGEFIGIFAINSAIALVQGGNFDNPQQAALMSGGPFSPTSFAMLFFLIAIVAPIAEELFFRGMLYALLRKWGAAVAIVGSAFIFAIVHFIPILIPSLFFVGLILGVMREKSMSLLPSILLHMLQNGIMIALIQLVLLGNAAPS